MVSYVGCYPTVVYFDRFFYARTEYRRNRYSPNKLEPVFRYKAVIMTSVEVELNLEIPIMVSTGPGNINKAG